MRIVSFLAPSSKQAMAELKTSLGDDAIIISTRTLDDGQVSVAGAVNEDIFNLADVLVASEQPRSLDWLNALAEFHEWSIKEHKRIEPILESVKPADPQIILMTLIEGIFRFDGSQPQKRKPVILSGPPGSGKTVTIAKLAAAHVLEGRTVDVVTLDVDRAGSLDQLGTLLSPLGLSPLAVPVPTDLQNTMAKCKGDVVLVDSASTNPFDPADLGKLSTLLARAGADLRLVLPAGLGTADSAEIARSYVVLGAEAMIVTKLDVARRFGGILAAAEAGLSFTCAGIGPTIGDGLCGLNASGIARLMLRRYRNSIGEEEAAR